jgi:hypothetical protein
VMDSLSRIQSRASRILARLSWTSRWSMALISQFRWQ